MKTALTFFTFCIFAVSSTAMAEPSTKSYLSKTSSKLSEFEVGRYQYCGEDRDCIAVNNGCCDCNSGGEDVAINKANLERFKARFTCNSVSCITKPRERVCLAGVVSCVNHKCKYVTDEEFDAKGGELKRGK